MKKSDKEIADGIVIEVGNTMKRIEKAHENAGLDGELKSDAYCRMKKEGMWNAQAIIKEYLLVKKKMSCCPSAIRQMCTNIFFCASTNYWAKALRKAKAKAGKNKSKE